MFIARNLRTSGAVRRGGTQLDKYLSSFTPPLRTAPEFLGPTSYKHVTPNGVKKQPLYHSARSHLRLAFPNTKRQSQPG